MMQTLCALTFLCTLSFLSLVLSLQCPDTQYTWPVNKPSLCCDKCPPGEHMVGRDERTCVIKCQPCLVDHYTEKYNVELACEVCINCNKTNMEYETLCSTTHNAVCRCKAGYTCRDPSCKSCVPIPRSITKPTPSPSTTAFEPETPTTPRKSSQPIKDTAWFLVIIALLCTGLALVVFTKIKPFLRWIKSKHGYFLDKEHAAVPQGSEDEEVSTPVQEALGKCDECDV